MKTRILSIWAAVMVMAGLAACKGESDLLDTIPADAPGIITVNVSHLMDAMDGRLYGGKLSAAETLDKFLTNSSPRCRQEITAILTSSSIDRGLMAGFAAANADRGIDAFKRPGKYIYTFKIRNLDNFIKEIGASSTPVETGGFQVYTLEDVSLFVKDSQGWIMYGNPETAAGILNGELDRAANTSASSSKALSKYLSGHDDIFRLAVARSAAADGWTCVTCDVDDSGKQLEVETTFLNPSGKKLDMGSYLRNIDTSMLSYTMPSDVIVMAVGIKSDTDWDALLDYVQSIYPLNYRKRALVGMVLPYLKRLDGTILLAAGPTLDERITADNFPNDINFVVAVQMKKEQVKKTIADLRDIFSMLGLPVIDKGDEMIMQSGNLAPVILKAIGNTIVLTNRPLNQLGNEAAKEVLKGNALAVWANIPNALGETVYGGRGFKVTMKLENKFDMTFAFNGSSAPVLEQFAEIIADDNDVTVTPADDADTDLGFTPIDTVR